MGSQPKEFLEIILEIDSLRPFIDKHIEIEAQDWYSLTTSQMGMVNMDIVNYMSKITPKEQLRIYKDFLDKVVD